MRVVCLIVGRVLVGAAGVNGGNEGALSTALAKSTEVAIGIVSF
jgi:hypothetical protein